ncbi:ubiquinone biosynthesis O-methyltransferase-like [Paramacrobiotus metropolitanus]|uniref:ubiquinone biosynthesis O-methyltransferase-like n=1 Tax=Paramacrobiotus metropolitanus TaxID=2943436 RepID=UPI002445BFE6|nr:ubiquinone biosynthesis O-methyltransferase-like [Paramacrobiotus metropolitanus]
MLQAALFLQNSISKNGLTKKPTYLRCLLCLLSKLVINGQKPEPAKWTERYEKVFRPVETKLDSAGLESARKRKRRTSQEVECQPFTSILEVNLFKLDLVKEAWAKEMLGCDMKALADSLKPFRGSRILEIGCGEGYFTEALFDLGAEATGYDLNEHMIEKAKSRIKETRNKIDDGPEFLCMPLQELVASRPEDYDIVVCNPEAFGYMIAHKHKFVEWCCGLVRNEGCIIFGVIDKSLSAIMQCVVIPEIVLKCTLPNSHHADTFITWKTLDRLVTKSGFGRANLAGMKFTAGSPIALCEKIDQLNGFYFYVGKKIFNNLWPKK